MFAKEQICYKMTDGKSAIVNDGDMNLYSVYRSHLKEGCLSISGIDAFLSPTNQ